MSYRTLRANAVSSEKIFRSRFAYTLVHRIENLTISRAFTSTDKIESESSNVQSPFIKRSERSNLRPSLYHVSSPDDSRIVRKSRLCPTRDLNYTPRAWALHKAPGRHLRHSLTVFQCASFQRLVFPDLFLTAAVAAGVTYYNVTMGATDPFFFDKTAFTSCTTAISVLAGFRLNTSYSRFNEARVILGQVNNASRDVMGESCMFLNKENTNRMQKLLKAFSVALHFHLNKKGGYFKLNGSDPETIPKVQAAYRDEMREIFFPPNENDTDGPSARDYELICEAYESGSHVPLLILSFMRKTIVEHKPPIDPRYEVSMDEQIGNLTIALGGCERILRTPVPVSVSECYSSSMSIGFHAAFPHHFTDSLRIPNINRLRSLLIQVGTFTNFLFDCGRSVSNITLTRTLFDLGSLNMLFFGIDS